MYTDRCRVPSLVKATSISSLAVVQLPSAHSKPQQMSRDYVTYSTVDQIIVCSPAVTLSSVNDSHIVKHYI